MHKLMRANIVRLVKNKVFWMCLVSVIAFAGISFVGNAEAKNAAGTFFSLAVMIPVLVAAFCPLFLGTEYNDGTIRNKLVVGHTRTGIYISNVLVCVLANLIMVAVFGVAVRAISFARGAKFEITLKEFCKFITVEIMMIIAVTALIVLFAMLNQNKAIVVTVSLLIVFAGLFGASYIGNRIYAEEYVEIYQPSEDGEMHSQRVKNSMYIQPENRKYWESAYDAIPSAQGIQISAGELARPKRVVLYSSMWILLATGAGLYFFRRKDIK